MSAGTSVPRPRAPGPGRTGPAMVAWLLREAPAAFAFIGPDSRLLAMSSGMTALSEAAKPGSRCAEVWPADLAAAARRAVRAVAGGTPPPPRTEHAIGGPGAARRWSFSWFPCSDGEIRGVGVIGVDISAPRGPDGAPCSSQEALRSGEGGAPPPGEEAPPPGEEPLPPGEEALPPGEAALRRSQERYRSLMRAGAQVVWVTGPGGEITEDSPEWRSVTGQSAAAYGRDGWLAAVHRDDRAAVERSWRECLRTGRVFESRYRVRSRSGSYRHYDVRAVPVERDGAIVEWMGASADVTAQREAEEMRGRLTEQLSAAALRTARLQQATSMLAEALTVEQVVEVITEVGRSAIGAERSAVAVLDTERLWLHTINPAGLPAGPGAPGADLPLSEPTVMTAAITARQAVWLESPEALRGHFAARGIDAGEFLAHTDEKAWAGLPLASSGAALGALRFSFSRPRQISEEERVFLEALAGQCALALERATLYEREHTTAETLQRSLLPDMLPEVPGMILAARCLPVTRTMEIGGDWYDAFRLPDGRLAVATGDVMGKGLTAAAGMGRVRNALRALALTDPRPAAVLAGLDRLFLATELAEQVTTLAYLAVDPLTGQGMAGNAGHPPPLLLAPGEPPRLDPAAAGTPLGWASPRQQYAFALPPGNTAVLYSDGLVENRRRGLDAGLDELVAVAGRVPAGVAADPGRLLGYLVAEMLAGYEQDDDVTVLVLHAPAEGRTGRNRRNASSVRKGKA